MISLVITFLAIILALGIGIAVTRKAFRHLPTSTDIDALTFDYQRARAMHKPSKAIGDKLVKARTEQIKRECA